ncbi:hypothetical protein [Nocardia sp. CA-119907]|uniref:hypothetical protein n=1 Tax=Nocardia sp. CA-119907 TaxID=3239973 RepID=UPI003D97E936
MTNKTYRTAVCQLLAKVALVGAAIVVPMTAAAVPAMAVPTHVPGVVQVGSPWGIGDWGIDGWGIDGWGSGDWGSGDWGSGDLDWDSGGLFGSS